MKKIAVLDTNVLMDLLICEDLDEEINEYIKLFNELEDKFDYDIHPLLNESNKTTDFYKAIVAKHVVDKRHLIYRMVKSCVEKYSKEHNFEACITERVKTELINNLTKEGESFEVDLKRLESGNRKYYRKVLSRFVYYRYKEKINLALSDYRILPPAPAKNIFVDDLKDGDSSIYNDCIFNGVNFIITNNIRDFKQLNSKYSKILGRKLTILPTFHSEEKYKKYFGTSLSETYSDKIIKLILEQYLY